MRITVLILGLLLGLVMFLQTFIVYALGSAAKDTNHAQAAAIGLVMALLWLLACAFVLPLPLVSVIAFALAALSGFAASKNFPDLAIWGGASLVLMALSFFGWRGKVKDRRRERAKEAVQTERDARYEAVLATQHRQDVPCPSCGKLNPSNVQFCGHCGAKLHAYGSQPGTP